jgi:hypothetical protein
MLGNKWSSTRGWKKSTEAMYRTACANGHLVRLQSGYANHTLFGWALLKHISPRGHPRDVVTAEAMLDAGCGHMSKGQYIARYCMVTNEVGEKCVATEVVVVFFARIWTREAKVVMRGEQLKGSRWVDAG